MKIIKVLTYLMVFSRIGYTQNLTEITNIIIYEHHFGPEDPIGSASAYDFVNHAYINGVTPGGSHPDRDMVEHNGLVATSIPFGFTSGISSTLDGFAEGNGLTKYFLATDFDYENATHSSIVDAYNSDEATLMKLCKQEKFILHKLEI